MLAKFSSTQLTLFALSHLATSIFSHNEQLINNWYARTSLHWEWTGRQVRSTARQHHQAAATQTIWTITDIFIANSSHTFIHFYHWHLMVNLLYLVEFSFCLKCLSQCAIANSAQPMHFGLMCNRFRDICSCHYVCLINVVPIQQTVHMTLFIPF